MNVIEVDKLSKKFKLGVYGGKTLRDDLSVWLAKLRGKQNPLITIGDESRVDQKGEFWALKDINFEVKQGEVLGIIGKNGAGKSTLLKLLSRISYPTSGEIRIKGRIASLLEVGTGFHPELTGKENVFLNGAILGMTQYDIAKKFDEIVAFSGIEHHIDTPVKRYSSGMKVRLGFAVAAHLEPEILIIDEVLAVGDVEFQNKCIGKMQDVSKAGRTILFVSHNMSAVHNLCSRAILLDKGKITFESTTSNTITKYLELNRSNSDLNYVNFNVDKNKKAQLLAAELLSQEQNIFQFDESVRLKLVFRIHEHRKTYYTNIVVEDTYGNKIFISSDEDYSDSLTMQIKSDEMITYEVIIPSNILKPGKYYMNIGINDKELGRIDKYDGVLSFIITDSKSWRSMKGLYRDKVLISPEVKWIAIT